MTGPAHRTWGRRATGAAGVAMVAGGLVLIPAAQAVARDDLLEVTTEPVTVAFDNVVAGGAYSFLVRVATQASGPVALSLSATPHGPPLLWPTVAQGSHTRGATLEVLRCASGWVRADPQQTDPQQGDPAQLSTVRTDPVCATGGQSLGPAQLLSAGGVAQVALPAGGPATTEVLQVRVVMAQHLDNSLMGQRGSLGFVITAQEQGPVPPTPSGPGELGVTGAGWLTWQWLLAAGAGALAVAGSRLIGRRTRLG